MVAANIQVTQGTGTRLATSSYTEGGVTVHDEKVIQGEPYLPTYTVAPLQAISTATLDSHLIEIRAGASLRVRIRRIEVYQSALATTAALMDIALYRITTAGTGGSSFTPTPLDTADASSGASAMTLPTAKGTEAQLIHFSRVYMMQTIGASAERTSPLLTIDFDSLRSGPLIIPAGTANGIALKNRDAVAAGSLYVNVWFSESSF